MIDLTLKHRACQVRQWLPSDSEENYKLFQNDGKQNYSKDAFMYKFNSDGFRCDEFSEESDLPILFLGCSFTEGIGLPIEEVWPSYVLSKIRSLPQYQGKKIPFWSIALGGTGLDSMSSRLLTHCKHLKPKFIFYFLSSYYRREWFFKDPTPYFWTPSYSPKNSLPFDISRLFLDRQYAYYQDYRSLGIINAVAGQYGSRVFIFEPDDATSIDEYLDLSSMYKNFEQISRNVLPPVPPPTLLNDELLYARDNKHSGSWWQKIIANQIWDIIKSQFD